VGSWWAPITFQFIIHNFCSCRFVLVLLLALLIVDIFLVTIAVASYHFTCIQSDSSHSLSSLSLLRTLRSSLSKLSKN
jgi:hypothetical protein